MNTSILHFSCQSCHVRRLHLLNWISFELRATECETYIYFRRRLYIWLPHVYRNKMSKLFISRAQKVRGCEIKILYALHRIHVRSTVTVNLAFCGSASQLNDGSSDAIKYRIAAVSRVFRCFTIFRDGMMLRHTATSQLNSSLWQIMHETADFRFHQIETQPQRNAVKFLEPNFQHFKDSSSRF